MKQPHKHVGDTGKPGQIINRPPAQAIADAKPVSKQIDEYKQSSEYSEGYEEGYKVGYRSGYLAGFHKTKIFEPNNENGR